MYKIKPRKQINTRMSFIAQLTLLCQLVIIILGALLIYQINVFSKLSYSRQEFSTIPKYQIDYSYIENHHKVSNAKLKKIAAIEIINEKNAPVKLNKNYIIVDISEQIAYTYIQDTFHKQYIISSGDEKNPDRKAYPSLWKISYYMDKDLTPLYGPCLLGLDVYRNGTWNATLRALHGTDTPEILGTPKSLGCIYFHNDDILEVCDLFSIGDFVINIE